MAVEIFMPKMTDHMEVGEIIAWRVKEGERVEQGQVILELMTDKVVAELESPASGVLKGIRPGAVDGARVPVGETIAFIAAPDETVPVLPPLAPIEGGAQVQAAPMEVAPALAVAQATPPKAEPVRATPIARRVARELGVHIAQVTGTGPGGRVSEDDVRKFAAASAVPAALPPVAVGTGAEFEWLELTGAQRLTGQRMLESVQQAPQFVLNVSADMTNALRLRETLQERIQAETGERLSVTAILVKVVAEALKNHPRANAAFENGRIKLYQVVNVGVAVGTDAGLIVPVVKQADRKSLVQIAREIRTFRDEAQGKRLNPDDLAGGTFTISNLGMLGIDRFDAIINPPQAAILAAGRVIQTPTVLPDESIAVCPLMSLSLTVDHRVMDGVQGARFLTEVKERLEKPYFAL